VWSHPYISPTINGSTLTFDVGTLRPGKMGHIFVHTSVPFNTAPGTVLTNTVVISSGNNDADLTNNSQVVTLTIPLLPPWIAFPRPGTTCSGMFTITGRVQLPGATVEVFIDHTSVASVTADAMGRWLHPVNLTDGTYFIQARAIYDGNTSPLSPPVKVIVDSSLVWSPLSLRFISENGHVVIPKDENGRTDEDGWFVFLRPGVTYTVTVYSCCDDPNTSITLELPGVEVVLQDDDGDGWFEATFTMPEATLLLPGSTIRLCVVCYNVEYCYDGEILIDPEGVVYDVTQGQQSLLQDAVVACFEGQTDLDSGVTTFDLWDAASYDQVNPQTTEEDGYFSFFTPAGVYQLGVEKDVYQPYRSWDLVVVDEPVEFNIPLTPDVAETADYVITVDDTGFVSPVLTVETGAVIEWVNVGNDYHTTTSITPSARIEELSLFAPGYTDGWDSGLLGSGESYKRQLNTAGSYYYHDHENTAYTGLIVVEGESLLYLPLVLKLQ
jgi:plastocyanin